MAIPKAVMAASTLQEKMSKPNLSESVLRLTNNSPEEFLSASAILLKLANNILRKPDDLKYRTIRLENDIVQNKLLPVFGAMECLFEMGFEEDGDCLKLVVGADLKNLQKITDEIATQRLALETKNQTTSNSDDEPAAAAAPLSSPTSILALNSAMKSGSASRKQNFGRKLISYKDQVLLYEDTELQKCARELIPTAILLKNAQDSLTEANTTGQSKGLTIRDCLLIELLAWFKEQFFTWMDNPSCHSCGSRTTAAGMAAPTPDDLLWGADRVESYSCVACGKNERFPRYTHPKKLLQTRSGRCGEWGNCFTLLCRCLGYDARLVIDWSDHVWTEVFSLSQKRWLHCDPCENKCDAPLLYESGWKKQLTYVIAFSKDEVQDVTWRYSSNHANVLERRKEVEESWLLSITTAMTKSLQTSFNKEQQKTFETRKVSELVEFLSPRPAKDGEFGGRISGALAWRRSRGEAGNQAHEPYIFSLTEQEKRRKIFTLKYSAVLDQYVRGSEDDNVINHWGSCLFECKNVVRKVEHDWQMVYLARSEGSDEAKICWKFDFSDSGLRVDKVTIKPMGLFTQETGQVITQMCTNEQCVRGFGKSEEVYAEFRGCTELTLTARLSGGNGECKWQHAQIFRQSLNSQHFPFDITITFS